jgi:NADH:ubiquinone oxidoreductase subunit 5 (subunit L)/multisubunit Na+/H+ antiporter MnhA subunit
MEHLGGLIHRMPLTGFAFLIGSAAISALPPFNGFVSEWLTFQAVLLSPSLPQWMLKFLVPAVGAMLALSAALAAGCFVKAFGATFLGRPRTSVAHVARETDAFSLAAMFVLVLLCLIAGVLPGYFMDALAPVTQQLVGAQLPLQRDLRWLTIVPIAQARSSYNGLLLFLLIAVAAWLVAYVIHRWASHAIRRSVAWDCGFPDPSPATQYTSGSFAQPIRRVFGSVAFHAREEVQMPPPGEMQAARFRVQLRDLVWDAFYAPVESAVLSVADRLNKVQTWTIRAYLTLVFSAVVVLLMVLAVWH